MIKQVWATKYVAAGQVNEGQFALAHKKSNLYTKPVIVLTEEKLRECFEQGQHSVSWFGESPQNLEYINEMFDEWLKEELEPISLPTDMKGGE